MVLPLQEEKSKSVNWQTIQCYFSQVPLAGSVIKLFSKATGLTLNANKCELMPVKSCSMISICNIPVKSSVTYLGIVITKDLTVRSSAHFKPVIEKTQVVFNHWLQKDLPLKGNISSSLCCSGVGSKCVSK